MANGPNIFQMLLVSLANTTRNLSNQLDQSGGTFTNRVTLNFDLLTPESMRAKNWTYQRVCVYQIWLLLAQVDFLSECGYTQIQKVTVVIDHRTTHRLQPVWVMKFVSDLAHTKNAKFSHTCYRALGSEVIPVYRQVTLSHPPGGRLPLLSARPAVTSVAFTR